MQESKSPYKHHNDQNSQIPTMQRNLQHDYDKSYPASQSNWHQVINKKRMRSSPELAERSNKQTKISDYWLKSPTPTVNKFSMLNDEEKDNLQYNTEEIHKPVKPPPIFVAGVNNIIPLTTLLETISKDEYVLKILNDDQVKIQPKTSEKYSTIVQALTEKKTQFHTYQTKEERSFRVVLRNMHHSIDIEELKKEIEENGHTVTNISNVRQRITKKPLPIFYVELKQNNNNKDIYNLEFLMHSKIKFEPPHQKREVPQCLNCQRYGHTRKFCNRTARCVKCAGDHLTMQCPRKGRSDDVKCVLCEGKHPANYKGCFVYKELQRKKYPALRERNIEPQPIAQKIPQLINIIPQRQVIPEVSYAQIAREKMQEVQDSNNNNQRQSTLQQGNDIFELKQMMKGLMEQMGTMLNLLTTLVSKLA